MADLWTPYFEGRFSDLIVAADQQLAGDGSAEALHISGLALLYGHDIDGGLARLWAASSILPNNLNWHSNAVIVLLEVNEPDAALSFAQAGLRVANSPALHFAHGNALMALNCFEDGANAFQSALDLDPTLLDARINLGNCCNRMQQYTEALSHYDAVLAKDPQSVIVLVNRATLLINTGRVQEAEAILATVPHSTLHQYPEVIFIVALLALARGDYQTGWDLYRARWKCWFSAEDRKTFTKPMAPDLPSIVGKSVLVVHEQGFGDSLQFVRFVPELRRHAANVAILCMPQLARLFAQSFPDVRIVQPGEPFEHDYVVPMLDMPYLLGTTLETIPDRIPYLKVPPSIAALRRQPGSRKLKVGLVWAGQFRKNCEAIDARRSVELKIFRPLMEIPGIIWTSLQLGEPQSQLADAGFKMRMPLESDFDFLDTAAIVKQLDLVITVDTAVAHLSAALGIPTWILSRHDGCWRWLEGRDDSPWYPKTVRLFRQTVPGDWTHEIGQIAEALAGQIRHRS